MPRASEAAEETRFVKLLLIGDGKIGKSYYAGLPGMHNFNVLYLNGDVAGETINQLPDSAKRNIYLMNVGDELSSGAVVSAFADFFTKFTSQIKVIWDDTNSRFYERGMDVSESEVWELRPAEIDFEWVLVIDSWTSLVHSVTTWAARIHKVNLQETDTPSMRKVYQSAGNKLTQFLMIIQRLKCHVIVLSHPDEYTKLEKPDGLRVGQIDEKDLRVAWTKLIPKSSSKPHAMTMSKFFTDVAWMVTNKAGTERQLDFTLSDERICGGHLTEKKKVETYDWPALIRAVGGHIPTAHPPITPALVIHPKGTYVHGAAPAGEGKVLDATATTAVVIKDSAVPEADTKPAPVGIAAMLAARKAAK